MRSLRLIYVSKSHDVQEEFFCAWRGIPGASESCAVAGAPFSPVAVPFLLPGDMHIAGPSVKCPVRKLTKAGGVCPKSVATLTQVKAVSYSQYLSQVRHHRPRDSGPWIRPSHTMRWLPMGTPRRNQSTSAGEGRPATSHADSRSMARTTRVVLSKY